MLAVRSIVHDLTGRQFGLLVVRRALARPYGRGAPFLICRCDGCGAAVFTTTHKLWRDHRTTWGNPRCRARLQQQQQRDPQSEHERISEMPVERRRLSSGNGAAPTLEARITRALAPDNATITSSAVAALFGEVETAITAAETAATVA